jgi:hypothetical protein
MIHRERRSNFPHLLIRLLRTYHVVYAKHNRQQIPHTLPFYPHGRPEASVQRSRNPGSAKVGARVQTREGLGTLEANELAKITCDVEVEERYEDGLPDSEFLGEEGGYSAEDWWAMTVASVFLLVYSDVG